MLVLQDFRGGRNVKADNPCWYCRGDLIWQSDFNYDEVHGEGEGIVSYLHCSNCGAMVEYSLKDEADQ